MKTHNWATEVRRRLYTELPVEVFHRVEFSMCGQDKKAVEVTLLLADGSKQTFKTTTDTKPADLVKEEIVKWAKEKDLC